MSRQSSHQALDDAYQQLHNLIERYGPLNRGRSVNMFKGVDMIDHQLSGLPLNKLGVMVVAAAKIKQWEAVTGQAYLNKIDEEQATDHFEEDPIRLMETARLQAKVPQEAAVGNIANESLAAEGHFSVGNPKPSTITVDKRYLYRLELENDLYRRHLSRYEVGVAHGLAALVQTIMSKDQSNALNTDPQGPIQEQSEPPVMSDAKVVECTEPKKKRVKSTSKEEKEALAILQKNFDEKRRKETVQE
ncbi:MAG: hypothetical protein M1830_001182 [Pleopsidium flavum]|nr:MAG: hypothetical protein M1830_001182 [Pleopsidium flavum]